MSPTKTRSFKKSTVDLDAAEKTKQANDAARALEANYKNKIIELKTARDDMATVASKYAMMFDVAEVAPIAIELSSKVEALESYLLTLGDFIRQSGSIRDQQLAHLVTQRKLCIEEIESSYDLTVANRLLKHITDSMDDYSRHSNNYNHYNHYDEYSRIPGQLLALISAVDVGKLQALKLDGVSYNQQLLGSTEYMAAIDKFLDLYSDILDMDPRNESEKSKGYKEYAAKILKDAVSDVAGLASDAVQGIADTATALKDGAVGVASLLSKGAYGFGSFVSSLFTTAEDKKFFAEMPTVDSAKLKKDILTNEVEVEEDESADSIADEVMKDAAQEELASDTQVSLPMADLSKTVKLTDALYSSAVHNNNQAEARNIVETSKAECIETAALMQKYVIQHCKGKNALATPEKCEDYNHKADLVMKNCGTMFPMETSYDSVLNEHIQFAVSEGVIISETGAITYVGAGAEVYNQPNFVPQLTGGDVIDNVNNHDGQQMLAGGESILTSTTTGALALGAPDNI